MLFVGVAAAGVRIRREEKEMGRNTQQTIDALRKRILLAKNGIGW
jgi:hypothetical protein